jgi:hypothetical protein
MESHRPVGFTFSRHSIRGPQATYPTPHRFTGPTSSVEQTTSTDGDDSDDGDHDGDLDDTDSATKLTAPHCIRLNHVRGSA